MAADIRRFSAIAPKVWKLLDELHAATGIRVEQIKFVQYSNNGAQILAYLDERETALEELLRGMHTIAARLGSEVQAADSYKTDVQPSGRGVTVIVRTAVDGLPLVLKALLDAEQYQQAVATMRLEVAA